ncbi:hypothetical protein Agub_g14231, partial [Astrephomene gubernaculifera]
CDIHTAEDLSYRELPGKPPTRSIIITINPVAWGTIVRRAALIRRELMWVVRDYLTKAGLEARQQQQGLFTQLKSQGMNPAWRNAAEIWVKPQGQERYTLYQA